MTSAPRLLTLDIETAPAVAYVWGIHEQHLGPINIIEPVRILSFAAKWHDEKRVIFASEYHNGRAPMLNMLWDLLDEADVVIHYNGTSFDVPHINREFLLAGHFPPAPYAQVDLWRTVRGQFKFLSNKLDSVATELGIGTKVKHEGFDLWKKCLAGDPAAWARMKRYNIGDVRLTESLYDELRPWIKNHPSLNLISGKAHSCPVCESTDLVKRGVARTKVSEFQKWRCNECGSYSRSGKRMAGVDLRSL